MNTEMVTADAKKLDMEIVRGGLDLIFETVRYSKKENKWVCRRSFFYTNGNSAEKLADKVKGLLAGVKILSAREVWKTWPEDSYWQVEVTLGEEAAS